MGDGDHRHRTQRALASCRYGDPEDRGQQKARWGPPRTLGAGHPLGGGEDGWGWGRRGRETQAGERGFAKAWGQPPTSRMKYPINSLQNSPARMLVAFCVGPFLSYL